MAARLRLTAASLSGTPLPPSPRPKVYFSRDHQDNEILPAASGMPDEPVRCGTRPHRDRGAGVRAHGIGGGSRSPGHRRVLGPPESNRQGIRESSHVELLEEQAKPPHIRHRLRPSRGQGGLSQAVRPSLRHYRASPAPGHDQAIRGGDTSPAFPRCDPPEEPRRSLHGLLGNPTPLHVHVRSVRADPERL